ncbi:hypothetical protein F5X99DRAFT_358064 [Biscogniauxia marginata]|nr:hypothetical protein F5X99DRAFT_358064 [Biscogniauxia marginata]
MGPIEVLASRAMHIACIRIIYSPVSVHDSEFNSEYDKTWAGAFTKRILRVVGNSSAVGARIVTDAAVNRGGRCMGSSSHFGRLYRKYFPTLL